MLGSYSYRASMPSAIRRICVYCASSLGSGNRFRDSAAELGTIMAANNVGLVYGGGRVGLMGTIADAVMDGGGHVTGVIPTAVFSREVGHSGITKLIEVDSMHTRKTKMSELADAFVALPGGLGTLEELFEIATWSQLGMHAKPIIVVDIDDYYAPLFDLIEGAVDAGLMKGVNRDILTRVTSVAEVLPAIDAYTREAVPKWIDADGT